MKNLLRVLFLLFTCSTLFAQNALNFDGFDDYILTSNSGPQGSSPRTVECWVKTNVVGSQRVMVDWGDMSLGNRFTLNMINGFPRIEIGGSGMNGNTLIADGTWHHVAAVYNPNASASNYLLYVDGNLDMSGPLTTTINTSSANPVIIGRRNDGINYWQGDLDEIRIWNVARTPSEISMNYQRELCSTPPDLWYYYLFNQGLPSGSNLTETTLIDQSILGNNGTLMNFTLNGTSSNWVNGQNLSSGSSSSSITANACGSYTSPSGNYIWSNSGNYTDTIVNASGCDSVISIALTVLPNSFSTISPNSCGIYTSPSGSIITFSGVYSDTINNTAGCDSIITINLTITYTDTSVAIIGNTLNANQNGASYQWMTCTGGNYQIIQGANSQTYNVTQSGNYAVEITRNSCVDTSSCIDFILSNINTENQFKVVSIYPNPAKKELNIAIESGSNEDISFVIYDIHGKKIKSFSVDQDISRVDVSELNSGIYIYELQSNSDIHRGKFVKE